MCIRDRLLAADQCDQRIDGRDARADVVAGIGAGHRVDRLAVDVGVGVRIDVPEAVDRLACAVENPAEQLLGERHLHRLAGEPGGGISEREGIGAFKHLHNHPLAHDLNNTAETD